MSNKTVSISIPTDTIDHNGFRYQSDLNKDLADQLERDAELRNWYIHGTEDKALLGWELEASAKRWIGLAQRIQRAGGCVGLAIAEQQYMAALAKEMVDRHGPSGH